MMIARPFFLITNDDGIHAPGIKHLFEAARHIGDVAVVAPRGEKSGSGLSITWTKPLLIEEYSWEGNTSAWSVSGTPADCVKMGLSMLVKRRPHLILSGVNRGSNSGRTVLYSGTIGGTIEGALRGIPGIAFSYSDFSPPDLSLSLPYLTSIIRYAVEHPPAPGTLFNVTFPTDMRNVQGVRFATQGAGYWVEAPEKRLHPEGTPYYWLGGKWGAHDESPDSDVALVERGYVTIVPIRVDNLTDRAAFETRQGHEKYFTLSPRELELDLNP